MKSLIQKRAAILLNEEDFQSLYTLMNSGFSFTQCLSVIERASNAQVLRQLKNHLELGEAADQFFSGYVPKKYKVYMTVFMRFISLTESMALSIELVHQQEDFLKQLKRGVIYPLFLMIGVGAGTAVFNATVLPSMLNLMDAFRVQDTSLYLGQCLLGIACRFIVLSFMAGILLLYFFTRKKRIASAYLFIAQRFPSGIIVQFASRQFACFFEQCIKKNISTRTSIALLKELDTQPIVSLLATQLDKEFVQGTAFEQAIASVNVEDTLARFFHIALYSSDAEEMLEGYLKMCTARFQHQISVFTRIVQSCCYLCIGIIILFVYRILMLPMNILQIM